MDFYHLRRCGLDPRIVVFPVKYARISMKLRTPIGVCTRVDEFATVPLRFPDDSVVHGARCSMGLSVTRVTERKQFWQPWW